MFKIKRNFSLRDLNTFRFPVKAQYFVKIEHEDDLIALLSDSTYRSMSKLILGGGSNILFTHDFPGLVIHNAILGIQKIDETPDTVILEIGAGENWHDLVTYVVNNNWGGIENLALIPGTVGAAPVQNIAAYGQNLVDVFESLDAINLNDPSKKTFSKEDCEFAYRSSIFKKELKDHYAITRVRLKLNKHNQINTSYFAIWIKYESIEKELERIAQKPHSIKDVYQAVVNIRTRQLPDVKDVPSVGSIFINPIITKDKLRELQRQIPELQFYPPEQAQYRQLTDPEFAQKEYVKVPAGRLLDTLGWRGRRVGNCYMYEKHAMIATHNGKATGEEMVQFINLVKENFYKHYGINLETEVSII